MTDDDYFEFCIANSCVRFERTADGAIIVVPPAGFESDHQNLDAAAQLHTWATRDGRGHASDPTAEFILPPGRRSRRMRPGSLMSSFSGFPRSSVESSRPSVLSSSSK
jgi:Uma2 family endonuclease